MDYSRFDIAGLVLVTPKRHGDERGWFSEVFREDSFRRTAGDVQFVQHNHSYSKPKGTVRGLHFQLAPKAQGKLVRCPRGRVLDVAVDLRTSSPTYGSHVAVELSAANGQQLWVPAGFAHGFCTLEEDCELAYMVTNYYSPEHDRGLRWNDPALGIDWPVSEADAILSPKDTRQLLLAELGAVFA
ncbi:dTDP-4-dehydrorhamnose 3,5-epimerase [Siculibacillus lacustris]|uniref:dTDP-4-dehydrorhamnose 3,5-epimerase n=1 Tax=Siculibacillus lacustris TaxID=1549641 RepID=A0A4Q9VBW6_9HYPH|nr:dTDP-4-dehydrorhamnose 3,5-epimerase [Siculibacillus lacustris]TBW31803.1 dTDP-4-dehydrorhamnose 3,5-epimerase [Siculibacillus lacustris]